MADTLPNTDLINASRLEQFLNGLLNIQGIQLSKDQDPNDAIQWLEQNGEVRIVNPNEIPTNEDKPLIINHLLTSPENLKKRLLSLDRKERVSNDPDHDKDAPIFMISWEQLVGLVATGDVIFTQYRLLVVGREDDIQSWQPSEERNQSTDPRFYKPLTEYANLLLSSQYQELTQLYRIIGGETPERINRIDEEHPSIQAYVKNKLTHKLYNWLAGSTGFYENRIKI